jgi:hypothetical protein
MAKFTFALPNGLLFTLNGPPGATVAQAEKIYLEQLAAGAFVGLRPGDQLQSFESTVIEFNQSRLARGTAGVPETPLLAIYNDGTLSGSTNLVDGATVQPQSNFNTDVPLVAIFKPGNGNPTIISSLPVLANVPINNGIDVTDYVDQTTVTEGIGPLSATQVQAILAAVASSVCQPADVATNELGVGKYGLSAQQLEDAGYLKCGTTARFLGNAQ